MKPENFNPRDYLPLNYYPWPNLINPHVDEIGKVMDDWIDNDYTFLSEKLKGKYKRQKQHYCMARMIPTASYERAVPCHRFIHFYDTLDDQMEFHTVEESEPILERLITILKGAQPLADENAFFQHAALFRDEFLAFMPEIWLERFIEALHRCFKYGIQGEAPYKGTSTIPRLAHYMVIREYSVNMLPFFYLVDVEINFVLPKFIEEHPIIQKLRTLAVRLIAWQNDIHSLPKELLLDTEVFNLVIVLQHEYNLSLEAALTETMRIHDADLAEFIILQENLPDFGTYQQQVYDYIKAIGTMIQGVNTFYIIDTARYAHEGFAWPERNISE